MRLMPALASLGVEHVVVLDWETFYDAGYSLRGITELEYVRDRRFQILYLGLELDGYAVKGTHNLDTINDWMLGIPWHKTAVIGHNLAFDGTVLVDKFGIRPLLWVDTLSMANNLVRPFTGSVSLENCLKWLMGQGGGMIPQKGKFLSQMRGVGRHNWTPAHIKGLGDYCKLDVRGTAVLAEHLLENFPPQELLLIHQTIKAIVEPRICIDTALLYKSAADVKAKQAELAAKADVDAAALRSNEKFAQLLIEAGVQPPMKTSEATGEMTYAFSKSDEEFMGLLDHPDPQVAALMAARLANKTSIAKTRAETLIRIGEAVEVLPAPIKYCGAGTTRMSGGGALNLQNLPNGSPIRDAMEAPEGHVFVVADAKQIEARTHSANMGQDDKTQQFRDGIDVYAVTASGLYNMEVSDKTHPKERKVGKVADLQLGYLAGAFVFRNFLWKQNIIVSEQEARSLVNRWRKQNSAIMQGSYELANRFYEMLKKDRDCAYQHSSGTFIYGKRGDTAFIKFPNGLKILYPEIRQGVDNFGRSGWGYTRRKGVSEKQQWFQLLRPNLIVNNATQGLARCITMQHALKLTQYEIMWLALTVHDELIFIVPEKYAERAAEACRLVMSKAPGPYAEHIPLAADVNIARRYGHAK